MWIWKNYCTSTSSRALNVLDLVHSIGSVVYIENVLWINISYVYICYLSSELICCILCVCICSWSLTTSVYLLHPTLCCTVLVCNESFIIVNMLYTFFVYIENITHAIIAIAESSCIMWTPRVYWNRRDIHFGIKSTPHHYHHHLPTIKQTAK